MTITAAQAKLLKDADKNDAGMLSETDRRGRADLATLQARGYVRTHQLWSGEVRFARTELGLAALIEWEDSRTFKGRWKSICSYFARNHLTWLQMVGAGGFIVGAIYAVIWFITEVLSGWWSSIF